MNEWAVCFEVRVGDGWGLCLMMVFCDGDIGVCASPFWGSLVCKLICVCARAFFSATARFRGRGGVRSGGIMWISMRLISVLVMPRLTCPALLMADQTVTHSIHGHESYFFYFIIIAIDNTTQLATVPPQGFECPTSQMNIESHCTAFTAQPSAERPAWMELEWVPDSASRYLNYFGLSSLPYATFCFNNEIKINK